MVGPSSFTAAAVAAPGPHSLVGLRAPQTHPVPALQPLSLP